MQDSIEDADIAGCVRMSHYRKIDTRIWNDAKFNSLDATGKLAFFMLLTHPMMTAVGAMRGTPGGLAEEMGFREDAMRFAFLDAFRDIIGKGMAEYSEDASLIALPNFVKYNPPTSINMIKAWENCLEFLPECDLKTKVIQRAVAYADGMAKAFRDAIPFAMRFPESREQRAENRDNNNLIHNQGKGSNRYTREKKTNVVHFNAEKQIDGDIEDDSGTYDSWPEYEGAQ